MMEKKEQEEHQIGIIHGCCCQCQKSYDLTNNCVTRRGKKKKK